MANNKKISYIIKNFVAKDMPQNIQCLFRQWLLSTDEESEKTTSLFEYWESLDNTVANSATFLSLEKLKNKISGGDKKRRQNFVFRVITVTAAATVIILFQVFLYKYLSRPQDDIYLLTAENSKGAFVLPDGSKVWLNENSVLKYSKDFSSYNRNVYLSGEAYFDIVKEKNKFVVETDFFDITVHGTKFNVNVQNDNDFAEVVLQKGKISLDGKYFSDELFLNPGDKFVMSKLNIKGSLEKVNALNYSRWIEQEMSLFNEPLMDIFTSMAHWYNVNIIVDDNVDVSMCLSMTIRRQSLEDMLKYISIVTDIDYNIAERNVTITPKKRNN